MTREEAKPYIGELKMYAKSKGWDEEYLTACDVAMNGLEQEPCEDTISRKSIKQKLQEHHDFFVNAYGGFSNLPQNDKSRVDEITNCIAMVVNEPPVTPQPRKGKWIKTPRAVMGEGYMWYCDKCNYEVYQDSSRSYPSENFCPNCGVDMRGVKE